MMDKGVFPLKNIKLVQIQGVKEIVIVAVLEILSLSIAVCWVMKTILNHNEENN